MSALHTYRLTWADPTHLPLDSGRLAVLLKPFRDDNILITGLFAHTGCGAYTQSAYGPMMLQITFRLSAANASQLAQRFAASMPGAEIVPVH